MSNGSLSTAVVVGIIIIVAVLASALTYYYASLNPRVETTTVTTTTAITSTTTLSLTKTEVSTTTTTKYVTQPPSTVTVTVTATPSTTPPVTVITVQRNDTAAQRLAEHELKYHLMQGIVTWLYWLWGSKSSSTIIQDPAATLATAILMRLTSHDVAVLPPLRSTYTINLTRTLMSFIPPQTMSNMTCLPISASAAHAAANITVKLRPVNATSVIGEVFGKLPVGGQVSNITITLLNSNEVRIAGTVKFTSKSTTLTVHALELFRNDLPVLFSMESGGVTHELAINSSNGVMILKSSGSTIKVIKGAESALEKILKSFKVTVSYAGTVNIKEVNVPVYRVFMTGDVRVNVGNVTFGLKLNFSGTAYLLGNNVLVFTMNSIDDLRTSVGMNNNTYCRYLEKPLVTHVNITAISLGNA